MSKFVIDPVYFTSVHNYKEWMTEAYLKMTDEERAFSILKGENHKCSSSSFTDHPEFLKLRAELKAKGYIDVVGNYINGDTTLKPFTLNGVKFKKGDRFVCASAMSHHIKLRYKE